MEKSRLTRRVRGSDQDTQDEAQIVFFFLLKTRCWGILTHVFIQLERCASCFCSKLQIKHHRYTHRGRLFAFFCIMVCALSTIQMPLLQPPNCTKAYQPLILLFQLCYSSMVTLLAEFTQKQSKRRKPFISAAGAQISREIAVNILSRFLCKRDATSFPLCCCIVESLGLS